METLLSNFLNNKKTLIFSLILGFLLFLPLISNAGVLIGTYNHWLSVDSPSGNATAESSNPNVNGPDILNVDDSIAISGDFRSFAKTIECTSHSGISCMCAVGEKYWTEWSPEEIEYRINGGSWQTIHSAPPPDPSPTVLLEECRPAADYENVQGSYSGSVDTSGLTKDGSWHELEVRGTSIGASANGEVTASFDFQVVATDNPQCSDGIDNDGDGDIDHPADAGCDNGNDDDESSDSLPDLEVSGAALANPPTATVGVATVFDFVIDNIGEGDAPAADVTCRLNGSVFDSGTSDALNSGETDWSWCQHDGISSAGNYTFEICVDDPDDIEEDNENNNCDSTSFTVEDPSLPDLDVTSGPSVSSGQLEEGSKIKFKATFKNVGDESAANSKVQFKVDGVSIYTTNLGSMSVNQSKVKTTGNWTATEGTHTIEACADYQDVVDEDNENNNCESTQITISDTDVPSVSLSADPTTVFDGEDTELTWVVGNADSCTASGGWSGSKDEDGGDEEIEELTSDTTFTITCTNDNGSADDSVTVTVDHTQGDSQVKVRAKLDGSNWTGSVNYTVLGPDTLSGTSVNTNHNDVSSGAWTLSYTSGGPAGAIFTGYEGGATKTVSVGGSITLRMLFETEDLGEPDLITNSLIARDFDADVTGTEFVEGVRLRFEATVHNQGDASSGEQSVLRFNRNGNEVSEASVQNLAPSTTSNTKNSILWVATEGSHTIQACADYDDDIDESNEGNNCRTIILTINAQTQCNDGIDNDGDGDIDYPDDSDCGSPGGETEESPQCSDGTDNDGDGWTDHPDDPSCSSGSDDDESDGEGSTQCSDGLDNDGDTFVDGNDPECSDASDNSEAPIQFEEF